MYQLASWTDPLISQIFRRVVVGLLLLSHQNTISHIPFIISQNTALIWPCIISVILTPDYGAILIKPLRHVFMLCSAESLIIIFILEGGLLISNPETNKTFPVFHFLRTKSGIKVGEDLAYR